MSSKRLISSEIYTDEFYISLDMMGRNLWIGLIIAAADDQGRMQDNIALIRSAVFPSDDFQMKEIEKYIADFAARGKILRYEKNGKKLIQITNWWKHQNPQWPAPSNFESPDGWTDRIKHHLSGGKTLVKNWDKAGGFGTCQPIQYFEADDEPYLDIEVGTNQYNNLESNLESNLDRCDGDGDSEGDSEGDIFNRQPAKKPPVTETKNLFHIEPQKRIPKHKHGEYKNVLLTDCDLEKLKQKFPSTYEEKIQRLSEGKEMRGYKYKNDYLAILKWAERDGYEEDRESQPVSLSELEAYITPEGERRFRRKGAQ